LVKQDEKNNLSLLSISYFPLVLLKKRFFRTSALKKIQGASKINFLLFYDFDALFICFFWCDSRAFEVRQNLYP
jgi:hypothetical protein